MMNIEEEYALGNGAGVPWQLSSIFA